MVVLKKQVTDIRAILIIIIHKQIDDIMHSLTYLLVLIFHSIDDPINSPIQQQDPDYMSPIASR